MKKTLSLLLCVVMITAALAGCAKKDENDKGAIIPVYLADAIDNFDPAYALHNVAGTRILGLIYEGLTYIDSNGKLQKAIAKNWTYKSDPAEDYYMLEIELKETAWNDGRAVAAEDFVFAWKRLLEPEFQSEAALMLYDILNARDVKTGNMTIDDIGLYAADTYVLQVQFEHDVDYMHFLENCASLALMPLREDKVVKLVDWASNPATMATNGPLNVKSYSAGKEMTLERNVYYYRDIENDSLEKYVRPYRLITDYSVNADTIIADFEADELFFISEIPLASRAAYADKANVSDTPITHTYLFNSSKAPFNKPEVRRALSLAIDRNEIVNIVKFAKAAEGFTTNADYRKAAGSLISSSADVNEAKSLLSAAGVSSGKFTISIRENQVDRAVAEYVKGVWEQLGFTVTIEVLDIEYYVEIEYDQYRDLFEEAYRNGNFDVIAVDMTDFSSDPFNSFGIYAEPFSGGALDLQSSSFDETIPHTGGYSAASLNELMEEIFAEKVIANRTTKLIEAEKILVSDMPAVPLYQHRTAYIISGELSNVKLNYFGYLDFKKTKLKDYMKYQTTAPVVTTDGDSTDG